MFGPNDTNLTKRELDVLQLLICELTAKEMAIKLCISYETVMTHKKNLIAKFNARNSVGVAVKAMRYGLIN